MLKNWEQITDLSPLDHYLSGQKRKRFHLRS